MSEFHTLTTRDEITPELINELQRRAHAERAAHMRAIGQRLVARVKSWFGLGRPQGTRPLAGANA